MSKRTKKKIKFTCKNSSDCGSEEYICEKKEEDSDGICVKRKDYIKNSAITIDGTMICPPNKPNKSILKPLTTEPEIIRPVSDKKRSIINKVKNTGRSLKKKTTSLFSRKPKKVTPRTTEGKLFNIKKRREKEEKKGRFISFITRSKKTKKQLNTEARNINPLHNVHMELKKKQNKEIN